LRGLDLNQGPSGRQPIALATLLTGLGLPLLLLIDLVAPRLWCQRLCPLGSAQDLLARPREWFRAKPRCPEPDPGVGFTQANQGRRWFLTVIAGVAAALAVKAVRGQTRPPLRPPGSVDDPQFAGVCVRCGNCAQVCPSQVIRPDVSAGGLTGFLAPRLDFTRDYCREDCHGCNRVCPSGAIARLSLAEKRRQIIGLARLDVATCLMVLGRECNACVQTCPYQAIAVDSSVDPFSPRPHVDPNRCNGCGACETVCPTRPFRAMRVLTSAGGQLGAQPGHPTH
jgi:ferredoxin-type protein NapF